MPNGTDIPSPSIGVENIDERSQHFVIGGTPEEPVYDATFTTARGGMAALVDATARLLEAEQSVKHVGKLTPAEALRVQRGAAKAVTAATVTLNKALASLGEHRQRLTGEMEQALGVETSRTSIADNQRAGEVRAFVRGLDPIKRADVLRNAINEGDREFVAGVLAMPRLAGLDSAEAATVRADAELKFSPDQFARRAEVDILSRRLGLAGRAFADRFGAMIGQGDSPAARTERALAALEGGAQ
jgi:hypothetical protein